MEFATASYYASGNKVLSLKLRTLLFFYELVKTAFLAVVDFMDIDAFWFAVLMISRNVPAVPASYHTVVDTSK